MMNPELEIADHNHPTAALSRVRRLSHIENWEELAGKAGYSVAALARDCGVSARTLERFFALTKLEPPRRWLKQLRMRRAAELLRDGSSVKETANLLGLKDHSHFSREFKHHVGVPPTHYANSHAKQHQIPAMSHLAT